MATAAFSLQQPIARTGRARLTAAYFATFIALGLTTGSLGPTLPALATQTNSSVSAISYLFTFRSLGYVFGSLRGGKLFDRHPGNSVMSVMILLAGATVLLVPFATHLWFLLAVMFALGAAEAGVDVGANTLLLRVHADRVAPFMSAMHSCFGIGALIAPIIVAWITLLGYPTTHSYFVLGILLLPVSLFTFSLPSPAVINDEPLSGHRNVTRAMVFSLSLFLFLYVGAEVGFAGWIFTYAITTRLATVVTAAYLTSLFWGSLTVGRALLIPIAARVKPETILAASLAGALLSLILMLLGPLSLWMLSVTTGALGLSMASIFPATLSLAGRRMRITGSVTSWFVVGSSLGATLIPLLIGKLFIPVGPTSVILVPAVALLFASGALRVLWTSK